MTPINDALHTLCDASGAAWGALYPAHGAFMSAGRFQKSTGIQHFMDAKAIGSTQLEPDRYYYDAAARIIEQDRGKTPAFIYVYLAAPAVVCFVALLYAKCPRVLMILRSWLCRLSMALVVYTTRRTAGGNAKNGITRSQARRQEAVTVGYFWPQAPRSNSSRAAAAASTLEAL